MCRVRYTCHLDTQGSFRERKKLLMKLMLKKLEMKALWLQYCLLCDYFLNMFLATVNVCSGPVWYAEFRGNASACVLLHGMICMQYFLLVRIFNTIYLQTT